MCCALVCACVCLFQCNAALTPDIPPPSLASFARSLQNSLPRTLLAPNTLARHGQYKTGQFDRSDASPLPPQLKHNFTETVKKRPRIEADPGEKEGGGELTQFWWLPRKRIAMMVHLSRLRLVKFSALVGSSILSFFLLTSLFETMKKRSNWREVLLDWTLFYMIVLFWMANRLLLSSYFHFTISPACKIKFWRTLWF